MAAPEQESGIEGPGGCIAALAIGPLTVSVFCAAAYAAGRRIDLAAEWPFILFQMAIVSLPFVAIAAVGGRRASWLTGLGVTALLWGWLLIDVLTAPPGRGVNFGLGAALLASPVLVTLASLGVWTLVERGRSGRG